jgi:hypothetical protein
LNGLEEYDWVIGKHFEENYSGNNHWISMHLRNEQWADCAARSTADV